MNICIGIISYFPDSGIRLERIARCSALLYKCREVFGVPIMVIAQGWRDEIPRGGLIVYDYAEPLTILGARQILRQKFLESGCDYMIQFDDDCILNGSAEDGQRLLDTLRQNPGKYLMRNNQFKLCAISKEIYSLFPLPTLSVDQGTGIEDAAFFARLAHFAPEARITGFNFGGLKDVSVWQGDSASTWNRQDIPGLVNKTIAYIKDFKTNP